MEIEDNRVRRVYYIHDIEPGKCFYFGCDLYMAIESMGDFKDIAVQLKTGKPRHFGIYEEVEPISAKVIVR